MLLRPFAPAAAAFLVLAALAPVSVAAEESGDGLGNAGETFIEDGVDKSPVRGINADGSVSTKGLADDESFKIPSFYDALVSDPACENADPAWREYLRELNVEYETLEEDEDTKAYVSWQFYQNMGFRVFKKLDNASKTCFLGACSLLYHISRHRIMVEGMYNSGVLMAKSLDRFVSSIHPSKFDDANRLPDGKWLWPVSDFLVGKLHRDILGFSRGREVDLNCGNAAGCKEGAMPLHGNAFHALPNDTLPEFPGRGSAGEPVLLKDAFKIYVYDVGEYAELQKLASGASFCKDNQWGFEVLLHWYFLACDCRTEDPDEADFFFVPQYTACHLNVKTFEEEGSDELFRALIPKLRHFARSGGRDHIFVWGGGFAVDGPFRSWREFIPDSIFLMTETEFWNPYKWQTERNYNFAKDIVLPGRISIKEIKQHDEYAVPMSMRQYTGDFVGWNRPLHTAQGKAESPRQRLLKWAAVHEDMHIRQDVPYQEALLGSINSRFCFVPRGKSAWSSRMFRVMFGKCVPVLLNDDYEIPFQSLLHNKSNWLVQWPMRDVNDTLAHLLRTMPDSQAEAMVSAAEEAKCWYVWPPPAIEIAHFELQEKDLDAACPQWRTKNGYLAVMALLRQKRRASKSSFRSYYMPMPDGSGKILHADANLAPV